MEKWKIIQHGINSIQKIFPELKVRFIAVNNFYDSNRELSTSERIANPIINLLNEYHIMETSQKIRSFQECSRQSGKFIGNHAVYGYVIKDKKLEVDPEASEIVKKIFEWRIDGMSINAIAEQLNSSGISSPLEHKVDNGIAVPGKHLKKGEKATWSFVTVRRILENPVYTGTLIQGKTTSANYRDRRRYKRDTSELKAFENAHEAIISNTTFLIVQDLLSKDTYCGKNKSKSYLFSGFAYCGNCGKALTHSQNKGYSALWKCINKECKAKGTIKEEVLENVVFTTLKKHMEVVLDYSEPVTTPEDLSLPKQDELKNQLIQVEKSKQNLLVQKESGIISEFDFIEMNDFYSAKISKIQFEIDELEKQKLKLLKCVDEIKEKYHKYFEMENLTRANIVTFIEKIEVFSKTKIKIYFRYENFFKKGSNE